MSSQNILQQIKNSHSLLPASRDRPRHPHDRPWQKSQQTETCAIANQLSQHIKMIYLPITQSPLEVRSPPIFRCNYSSFFPPIVSQLTRAIALTYTV